MYPHKQGRNPRKNHHHHTKIIGHLKSSKQNTNENEFFAKPDNKEKKKTKIIENTKDEN